MICFQGDRLSQGRAGAAGSFSYTWVWPVQPLPGGDLRGELGPPGPTLAAWNCAWASTCPGHEPPREPDRPVPPPRARSTG